MPSEQSETEPVGHRDILLSFMGEHAGKIGIGSAIFFAVYTGIALGATVNAYVIPIEFYQTETMQEELSTSPNISYPIITVFYAIAAWAGLSLAYNCWGDEDNLRSKNK